MKINVELIYENGKEPRPLKVKLKDGLKGARLMNAIDKEVERMAKDDPDWQRWNLLSVD